MQAENFNITLTEHSSFIKQYAFYCQTVRSQESVVVTVFHTKVVQNWSFILLIHNF